MASTPPLSSRQNAARSSAPGMRQLIPMIAIGSWRARSIASSFVVASSSASRSWRVTASGGAMDPHPHGVEMRQPRRAHDPVRLIAGALERERDAQPFELESVLAAGQQPRARRIEEEARRIARDDEL